MFPVALLLAHKLSRNFLRKTRMAGFEAVMAVIPENPTMPKRLTTQLFQYPLPSNRLFPQYDQRGCFGVPGHPLFFCPVRLRRIANLLQRHPRCADSKQRYFSVRRLPLRAEVTIYYVICPHRSSVRLPGSRLRRSLFYRFSICFPCFSLSETEKKGKTIE